LPKPKDPGRQRNNKSDATAMKSAITPKDVMRLKDEASCTFVVLRVI